MMNLEEKDLDLYELLEINYNSTKEEIDKAYRRKAMIYHPDKNRNNVEAATKIFHQISVAYETLTDPQKKLQYDNIYKAKIESKKRFEKLDTKRKAMKEELEEREKAVKQAKKTAVYTQESCEAKIERIREETARRRREREEKLRLLADQRSKASTYRTNSAPSSTASKNSFKIPVSSSKPVFGYRRKSDFESIVLNKMIEREKLEKEKQ
ncbi:DnaJ domain-containing protein [Glomus cerebriforme]|uniref:DnaJ domain-containing protein n=1 Tax=Glomus cerebriforme TaxID=658196 RepID=A0A397TRP6_9GLOM|nr:DnaJ domain-containing protein [Glomus cerebriforme]